MDIELKLFAAYERSYDSYMIRVAINSETFSTVQDAAQFDTWGGDATVRFSTGSGLPEQKTTLPKTGKGKAALAQATTIFAPQLLKAIQAETGMGDALAKRLIAEKQFVVEGFRKDALTVMGVERRSYRSDGVSAARVNHNFALETLGRDVAYVSGWGAVGEIYNIPGDASAGVCTLASPELLCGKRLLMAKSFDQPRSFSGRFYFAAADVGDPNKQIAVDGAEFFAQADLSWLFTAFTGLSANGNATFNRDHPLVVTREVK